MQLNLQPVLRQPDEALPFSFDLDLSDAEFYGVRPFAEPVRVSGEVRAHAEDLLVMTGQAETTLHVFCDRCGKPFLRPLTVPFRHMLADHLEDEEDGENDEIILYRGTLLDPDRTLTDDVFFGMDSSNLCREDCKGRCFRCGKDLNEGPCDCVPEADPRLAVLAQLLEQQES